MTFDKINRRTHVYLAMFLMPWLLMYAASSIPFNHRSFFDELYKGTPQTTLRFDREYRIDIPPDADLRRIGAQILKENGLEGSFHAYRSNENTFNIFLFTFLSSTEIKYFEDQNRLLVEDRAFRWDHILGGMHGRGGFAQTIFLADAWGVVVELVMIAILVWIGTGLYMWYKQRPTWFWGSIALGGGMISMLAFLVGL